MDQNFVEHYCSVTAATTQADLVFCREQIWCQNLVSFQDADGFLHKMVVAALLSQVLCYPSAIFVAAATTAAAPRPPPAATSFQRSHCPH